MDTRLHPTALPGATAPDDTSAPAIAPADDAAYRKKAEQAAVKFESFFIGHMLKQMRSSTKALSADDSIYKNSINSDMLDMADGLVADQLAGQRAFGVADAILRQLMPAPAAPRGPALTTSDVTPKTTQIVDTKNKPQA
ncbi:rod-binding protein [Pseudoduganella armeniaca]|uniref:Flagellar biosynthesis protein FlgJ n=1 Tax=Pseudoduganella armeniaca TaxID=2072590 RepID=A0A2R4CCZ5_9BURK|nr:rod-binding protein [Pseudoduganella armeniaca]AVR97350.1 flagellar biosynthesis protein FlgJ [Pseudoduganella armeniaca]